MGKTDEDAWSRYAAGVNETLSTVWRRAIRCTLVVDPEQYPDNRRLVEVLDALLSKRTIGPDAPSVSLSDGLTLAFHSSCMKGSCPDNDLLTYNFVGDVVVERASAERAEFLLNGVSDGRELQLYVGRRHGQYTLYSAVRNAASMMRHQ